MSYILEALRKSDKQRQRGTAPTLLTAQATVAAPKPPAPLRYVLLGVALVGAGIAIGWLRPWQPEPPAPAPLAAAKPPQPGPRQAAPAPLPASPEIAATREPESTPAAPSAPMPTSALIKEEDLPAHRVPPKVVAAVPKKAETPVPRKPVQEQSVMTMAELPVQIQQEIPSMSIAVHAYSSQPKNRLVSINDRLLHEGMSLAPGLKLEEITPDGMIFSYKGYRFSRRAPGTGAPAETR